MPLASRHFFSRKKCYFYPPFLFFPQAPALFVSLLGCSADATASLGSLAEGDTASEWMQGVSNNDNIPNQ